MTQEEIERAIDIAWESNGEKLVYTSQQILFIED